MPKERGDGAWPYRGFIVRYHRHAADALWWAEIPDAPEIAPLTGPTYVAVRTAAEQAIDALIAQGHPEQDAPTRIPPRGRYHRITVYLATLPDAQQEVVLSFADLEKVLGGPPPMSARTKRSYWTTASPRLTHAWTAAGWSARLDERAQAVIFTRIAATPA